MTIPGKHVRLFTAIENCRLQLSPQQPLVLCRREHPGQLTLPDPSFTTDPAGMVCFEVRDGEIELTPVDGRTVLLNGVKLSTATILRPGDRIRVGYTTLVVQAIEDVAGDAPSSVKTVSLATSFVQQRAPLDLAADQLAQWSEGFEEMSRAVDDDQAAAAALGQLTSLVSGSLGIIAAGEPPRELASYGLTAADAERALRWLAALPAGMDVQTPTGAEVFSNESDRRVAIGRVATEEGQCWYVLMELVQRHNETAAASRIRSVLANLLRLHYTLHARQTERRQVNELRDTVKVYAQPAEDEAFETVRRKFVYQSSPMRRICQSLARAAAAPSPVLLLGEPGTGKQLAAEAVHAASNRRHREMVALSLVELPENLIESQLFGHREGMFSGATRAHQGLITHADGGTLFLDEIGDVPPSIQVKLLRVLEYGQFYRIGDNHPTQVDVRLITATNRDLVAAVRSGQFRQDLYDRISVIPIVLPPLRERADDIPILVDHFLAAFNAQMDKRIEISPGAMEMLGRQTWPNNVRGLQKFIERLVVMAAARARVYQAEELSGLLPQVQTDPQYMHIDEVTRRLEEEGRHNQSRILRELKSHSSRMSKGDWGKRVGLSRPVFRSELKKLIRYCVEHDVPVAFFEQRLKLREEDRQFLADEVGTSSFQDED